MPSISMLKKPKLVQNQNSSIIKSNFNFFQALPDAIIRNIFAFLKPHECANLYYVDKRFNLLANEKIYWEDAIANLFTKEINHKLLFHKVDATLDKLAKAAIVLLKAAKLSDENETEPSFKLADAKIEITREEIIYAYYGRFKALVADFNPTVILDKIENLLKKYYGPIQNQAIDLTLTGCINQTFLHFFATLGHLETLRRLLAAGLDLNTQDFFGTKPLELIFAFNAPTTSMLDFLLENGAIFHLANDDQTPTKLTQPSNESSLSGNIICDICLMHAVNPQYLQALAYLINKQAFHETYVNKLLTYISSILDERALAIFDNAFKSYPTSNTLKNN